MCQYLLAVHMWTTNWGHLIVHLESGKSAIAKKKSWKLKFWEFVSETLVLHHLKCDKQDIISKALAIK